MSATFAVTERLIDDFEFRIRTEAPNAWSRVERPPPEETRATHTRWPTAIKPATASSICRPFPTGTQSPATSMYVVFE